MMPPRAKFTPSAWTDAANLKIMCEALRDKARALGKEAREAAHASPSKEKRLRQKWKATRHLINAIKLRLSA